MRLLLLYLNNRPDEMAALASYFDSLSPERQHRIRRVAEENALALPRS